jgi:cytochrome b561/polyisoprenoid-binding protein YceI
MAFANSKHQYGGVAKTLHWLVALLILTLLPLGWYADELPYDTSAELARKAWFFSLHKTLGVAVFFVALVRIFWALSQPRPAPLHPERRVELFLAELVHWSLYLALVIVPLSGWIAHAAAAGFAPIWWPFGQDLPLVPKSAQIEALSGGVHYVAGRVLMLSLALHVAGALKHHVIDRDATLRRMLPGSVDLPAAAPRHHNRPPLIAAVALWALTITGGGLLSGGEAAQPPVAALEAPASEWQVRDGSVAITVTQFGSDITGSFEDWTAAITYDPEMTNRVAGHVTATINIASLTLGSVTAQAMGPDFFDATTYPTATFDADIVNVPDGVAAQGTLRIKDQIVPLRMPFGLELDADTATMRGSVTLDRRAFGIGDNLDGEKSLKFAVDVMVNLTADRVK